MRRRGGGLHRAAAVRLPPGRGPNPRAAPRWPGPRQGLGAPGLDWTGRERSRRPLGSFFSSPLLHGSARGGGASSPWIRDGAARGGRGGGGASSPRIRDGARQGIALHPGGRSWRCRGGVKVTKIGHARSCCPGR